MEGKRIKFILDVSGLLGSTIATTIVSSAVTVPIGGVVAVGALLTYGGYTMYKRVKDKEYNAERMHFN